MTSPNDTTILAMLSRYPDMSPEEADGYISKIEHVENVAVCHAVLGRIDRTELNEDARQTFDEFQRWSRSRTRRTREEQWTSRERRRETKLALKMNALFERGVITESVLMMYGISGDLPDRERYMLLSPEEKEAMWAERMEMRLGPNWRSRITHSAVPADFHRREITKTNWLKEGF